MHPWRWIVRWYPRYSSHPLVLAEDGGYTHWLWGRETCLSSDHCLFDTWVCLASGWLSLSRDIEMLTVLALWVIQVWKHTSSTDLCWASKGLLDNHCLFHTYINLAVGTIKVLMQKSLLREMKWCPQGHTAGKCQVEESGSSAGDMSSVGCGTESAQYGARPLGGTHPQGIQR